MQSLLILFFWLSLFLVPWGYHIVYCFQHKEYILLAVGAIIAPLGWIHGLGAFFGWW